MLCTRLAIVVMSALVVVLTSPATVSAQQADPVAEPAATRICTENPIGLMTGVVRVSGADRYQTAVAVSQLRFADLQGCTVSVASGRTFPDALTAAANIQFGPLLLVPGNSLPGSVTTEINRLDPAMIISYGGSAVITPSVKEQLANLVGGVIVMNNGANRFDTAKVASADNTTGQTTYIATGADYPDALAAVPLIRRTNGSFLLVSRTGIPAETRQALGWLRPSNIVIIGGTGSVSAEVEQSLRSYTTGAVTRIEGADRYQTAVRISEEAPFSGGGGAVVIVSGRSFADALAASSLDIGPVLLVEPDSIPDVVRDRLQLIRPDTIFIVGGTASVSQAVAAELDQFLR